MINKFPGKCSCGMRVEAGEGTARKDGTKWVVVCSECAQDGATTAAEPARTAAPAQSTYKRPDHGTSAAQSYHTAMRRGDGYVLLSGHKASDYQAAIFEHFEHGHGSRIICAVAGSGKTSSVKNALRYLDERLFVQMFAFNVDAARQLKDAIAELEATGDKSYRRVNAGTFHSVGLRAVLKYLSLPETDINIEDSKVRKLFKNLLNYDNSEEGKVLYNIYSQFVLQLVGHAKGQGIGCLRPDIDGNWWHIIHHHGMSLDSEEGKPEVAIGYARAILETSNIAAKKGWLDYNDMLYLPILWRLKLWQNDVVICDEAQDTSPVRRAILHLSLRNAGRLYAVGDKKQSIYGFCGADNDAMDLIQQEFNCREMPLTVSYRCARKIVERAQTWVPYIEASDFAEEGIVDDDVPLHLALSSLTHRDAILCRQTAPLVEVAYKLISVGRACRIAGKEIGEGLINLVEQQNAKGIVRLKDKLTKWRDREVASFTAKGEETRAEAVADRVACIMVIIDALPETERTIPALIRKIESLFSDGDDRREVLTLSTIHKAKGREWDCVAILRPELSPSRAARREWQMEQEENLQYVAATRAKTHLIYCLPGDMEIVPPNNNVNADPFKKAA